MGDSGAVELDPISHRDYDYKYYYPYTKVPNPNEKTTKGARGMTQMIRSQADVLDRLRFLRQQMDRDYRVINVKTQKMSRSTAHKPEVTSDVSAMVRSQEDVLDKLRNIRRAMEREDRQDEIRRRSEQKVIGMRAQENST